MTALAYLRGHLCKYQNGKWIYSDSGIVAGEEIRTCKRCGQIPTVEGYDACLGYIPGVTSACCGHGVGEGFSL